jgi:2-haloacid dehalogenase
MNIDHEGASPAAAVFDAYGTIFDFGSAVRRRAGTIGGSVATLIDTWRTKQLQYTWLRSLQQQYVNFEQVTADALDYALDVVAIRDDALRNDLLALYVTLDAFPDALRALKELRNARIPCWILSNGTPEMLDAAVSAAGLAPLIDGVLSVESVGVYKPDPRVYQLAVDELGVAADRLVFVSANGWDAFAAAHFGMSTVWCNRAGQPAERLPGTPTHQVTSLEDLAAVLGVGGAGPKAR